MQDMNYKMCIGGNKPPGDSLGCVIWYLRNVLSKNGDQLTESELKTQKTQKMSPVYVAGHLMQKNCIFNNTGAEI